MCLCGGRQELHCGSSTVSGLTVGGGEVEGEPMSIWRWAEWMDAVPEEARISLGEGDTPLLRSRRLGPSCGLEHLYFKLEFANPTASYKDRFAVTAVSHMKAAGRTRCVATSSGNTGSALAAYCAAAGIECLIAIVEGAP